MTVKEPALALEALPDVFLEASGPAIHADELIEVIEEEFGRQGQMPPADKLLALARVVAGYLRTCPVPDSSSPHGQAEAVAAFVAACPAWWMRDYGDYGKLATLLDDVFHQREVRPPPPPALEMLHGLTVGIMRRKRLPRTHAAQLAMADWVAALYLAGLDDW